KNVGDTGQLLADLVGQIKSFDSTIDGTNKGKGIFKIFHNAKKEIDTIIAKYSKIETNIDTIEKGLDKNKIQLLKDISIFDELYEKNLEYFKEISLYIIAGERKLDELRNVTLPELKKKAEETGEQLDIQKVQDMEAQINRFEKKIYDLKTTRIISIQMAPQIRLLQNNDAELVEKIQSSITNTIPLWKNQMVLSLGINNAKKALKEQQAVTNLTNEMLKKNSETLKQGTIDIAKESERAIVDIETLKKTNKDLIDTLDSVIKIHEEGRAKRAEAEVELQNIEKELKDKILEINVKGKE
ncbi:MAG: toxic anion resistance protein, partial [Bacilli bacterium]|nr:toxic anion resistance protein [Bacilli bacterium]